MLTGASAQKWSSKTEDKFGCRYYISYETTNTNTAKADTLWIGEKCFPLKEYDANEIESYNSNIRLVKDVEIKSKWTYNIYVDEDLTADERYTYKPSGYTQQEETKVKKPTPPIYNGAAAVSYFCNGKRYLKEIASFKIMQPIYYP